MDEEPIRIISEEEAKQLRGDDHGEDLELGRKIWESALQGRNRDQIAQKLKIPIEELENTLNAYRTRLGLSIDFYRQLDNHRLDQIVATWMPAATEGSDIKAGYLVIQAITTRIRILGATGALAAPAEAAGGLEGAKVYNDRTIVLWLRDVMPSIEKITREVEAEVVS
jgi:hypothetical protein